MSLVASRRKEVPDLQSADSWQVGLPIVMNAHCANPRRGVDTPSQHFLTMKSIHPRIVLTRIGELPSTAYEIHERTLDSPLAVFRYWNEIIAIQPDHEGDKEQLVAILVTTKMKPLGYHEISRGSLNESIAHPREIFRSVIIAGAHGLVLAHNHPSGDPGPSDADKRLTTRIRDAAELLRITLFDHIVIGRPAGNHPGYFSFREAGLI